MQNFEELNLKPLLLKSIQDQGYTAPTPIQAQTLPILLGEPTDFLGLAATGTGKTAAYSIPMLEKLDPNLQAQQALILCPTRELAVQVAGQIDLLGRNLGIRSIAVYGGSSYSEQIHALKQGAPVVVGTPGRIVDHIGRGTLKLDNLKVLILDEADEMISMGFAEDMEQILAAMPKESCNTWLFSATMSPQVNRVAKTYLRNPRHVQVNRTEVLSTNVEQLYYPTRESDKPEILCKLIDAAEDFYGIIFCQTKALVADLSLLLNDKGYKVGSLHGDKDQSSRERTLNAFRDRKIRILVCTDVASRGIDVKDITHVVNYSLPREFDNYVHRIGRTARSGKNGIAMNLVSPSHRHLVTALERFTRSKMTEGKIPSRKEIASIKVSRILPRFEEQPHAIKALEVLGEDWKSQLAGLSTEEVASRFLAMMLPDLFNDQNREATLVNMPKEPPRGGRRFNPGGPQDRNLRFRRDDQSRYEKRSSQRGSEERPRYPKRDEERPRYPKRDGDRPQLKDDERPRFKDEGSRFKKDHGGGDEKPRFRKEFSGASRFKDRAEGSSERSERRPAPRLRSSEDGPQAGGFRSKSKFGGDKPPRRPTGGSSRFAPRRDADRD